MSGPFLISYAGTALAGVELNVLPLNGLSGLAALSVELVDDEVVFTSVLASKLDVKEKLCLPDQTPKDRRHKWEYIVPNCTKVK